MTLDNEHTTSDASEKTSRRLPTWSRLPAAEADDYSRSIDWAAREGGGRGLLRGLERLALAVENLVNKLAGNLLANPFYHTDTIAFFLLVVVAATGVYLAMFYQFGYEASYESIVRLNRFPLSWLLRGTHRYAAGALMLVTLLHALRIFFLDRFRGARRRAWAWGVGLTILLWLAGISGYLLLWDSRAQLIVQSFLALLQPAPSLAGALYSGLVTDAANEKSWLVMLLLLGIHVGVSALGGLFFWYHIQRLQRPKLLPSRTWMIGSGVLLLLLTILLTVALLPEGNVTPRPSQTGPPRTGLLQVGMLPMLDFSRLPGPMPLDLFFLFYLPFSPKGSALGLLAGLVVVAAVLALVPWIVRRREPPRIVVNAELCVGCKLCVADCPYGALTMQPREISRVQSGLPRPDNGGMGAASAKGSKEIAVVDPARCVACGICIGSCSTLALGLGQRPARLLWQDVAARLHLLSSSPPVGTEGGRIRLVFACERHAAHGARPFLRPSPDAPAPVVGDVQVEVVPVTCAAMLHPGLLTRALEASAAEVQVVGCPPDDCANREGNLWLEERLLRERAPRLQRKFAAAPILTTWLPPDQFERALSLPVASLSGTKRDENLAAAQSSPSPSPSPEGGELVPSPPGGEGADRRSGGEGGVGGEDQRSTWQRVFPSLTARNVAVSLGLVALLLVLAGGLASIPYTPYAADEAAIQVAVRGVEGQSLTLAVDGQSVLETDGRATVFERIPIPPGQRQVSLRLGEGDRVLFDETVNLEGRQVLPLTFDVSR